MNGTITVRQAAQELGVSPQRVRKLIADGFLKAELMNPRFLLIRKQDLKAVAIRHKGRPRKSVKG